MAMIIDDPNFDPRTFNPNSNITTSDNYNGLVKNDPFEPTFEIDPQTGKVVSVATISRYNKVRIGDFQFPGSSTLKIRREKKVSIEKGKKGAGNKVIDTGIDLAKITIVTDLFNNNDLDDWQDVLNYFEGRKGIKASDTGFSIFNPSTTARGIKYVYLEGIEGPEYSSGKTTYTTNWVEIIKVKKTTTKKIATPKQESTGGILSKEKVPGVKPTTPPSKDPNVIQPK